MQIDVDVQFLRERYADHKEKVRIAQNSVVFAIENQKQQRVSNAWARYTTAQDRKAEFMELMAHMGLLSCIIEEEEIAGDHAD